MLFHLESLEKKKFKSFEYKEINNPASYFKGAGTLERKFLLDTMRICNLCIDMCFPNNECGILTSVDSDEHVQSPFKLGNSKSVSIITLIENSSD